MGFVAFHALFLFHHFRLHGLVVGLHFVERNNAVIAGVRRHHLPVFFGFGGLVGEELVAADIAVLVGVNFGEMRGELGLQVALAFPFVMIGECAGRGKRSGAG